MAVTSATCFSDPLATDLLAPFLLTLPLVKSVKVLFIAALQVAASQMPLLVVICRLVLAQETFSARIDTCILATVVFVHAQTQQFVDDLRA